MLFYEPQENERMGVKRVQMAAAVGANVIVTAVVVLPLTLWNVRQASGLAMAPMLTSIIRPFVAASGAGVVAYGVSLASPGPWLALLVGGVCGSAFYVAVLARWARTLMVETMILHGRSGS